ncbi:hypothetical protein EZS27_021490 [termite gut metagenome]|jgi:hypothetical protein|uniref:Uncharacterized protein n=1 Tax=termite gut metagenome TaxID=433724 RepID=A0A5J4R9H0_9ZZZZ
MKNKLLSAIVECLNYSRPDKDKFITLNSNEIQLETDINFFELNGLYLELKKEGYELQYMAKDSIKVLKTKDTIYFK